MKKGGLLTQVIVFFLVGVILTAILSNVVLKEISDKNVLREKETLSSGVTADIESSLREYRACEWVLDYLITHAGDDLDLEYESSEKTEPKEKAFLKRNAGVSLTGSSAEQIEALSPEEQKCFAEIVFNHWLLRMNELKRVYDAAFLYFFASDDSYENAMFLITASDGSRERGSGPDNSYVMGTTVAITPGQSEMFRNLQTAQGEFVYTDDLADSYRYLFRVGEMNVITGMTFEIASIRQDVETQMRQYITYFVLLQIMLSVFCLLYVYFCVLKPLMKVRVNVTEYTESKDGEKARKQLGEIHLGNEIGDLAERISDMTGEIDEYLEEIRSITAEKERIGAELNVARQIQADLVPNIFPPFPGIREFDVYATMDPAKEVGGDFYDFFMVDESHVALTIADVSGKGVPAALFMIITKTILKNRALLGGTPAEILRDVNNQLCANNTSNLFVTLWIAIIDTRTGKGIAANAGHERPVLRRANGSYELVRYVHSPALAIMEGMDYREHEFRLNAGDRIFVYTDGVTEASNRNEELFGTERMLASLNENPEAGQEELLRRLKEDIDRFAGDAEQFDDITMMVFDYKGKNGENA